MIDGLLIARLPSRSRPSADRHRMETRMRFARALSLFLAACLGIFGLAWAHWAPVSVTATATPATATLSRTGVPNYAAYVVTINNPTSQPLKYVQFSAKTTVAPTSGIARFFSSSGLPTPCTAAGTDGSSVQCGIPVPINPGAKLSFTLVFTTPTAGTSITFASKTIVGDDAYHCNPPLLASATTSLEAPSDDGVVSYVPLTGATVFTGTGSSPSATTADPWTTTVTIPPGTATTATIGESVNPNSCSADLLTCNISSLTIPGTFNHLVITLRRDVSTIASSGDDDDDDDHGSHGKDGQWTRGHDKDPRHGGWSRKPNIDNAVIYYEHVLGAGFVPVPNCSDDPSLPQAGRPCIKSRKAFPKCPPTPLIDQGDWWFEIWAIDNGRYQG